MTYAPNLDAYFTRTGYQGSREPSLATLNAIVFAHVRTIPFENLDVLLGRGVDLDPRAVERKLVDDRRGGYCFEQNSLLLQILLALGFDATPLSARGRIGRPREMIPPRTHMFLRVEIDGEAWLADVGVGALSPTCALRLHSEAVQTTPHEPRRLLREGEWAGPEVRGPHARILHQVQLGDDWKDVCELTLEPMPEIDREVGNWFTSTHPGSHFRDRLMVARATDRGRLTLLNRTLTSRTADGRSETQDIASPEELLAVLERHFGITLSDDFDAGAIFLK